MSQKGVPWGVAQGVPWGTIGDTLMRHRIPLLHAPVIPRPRLLAHMADWRRCRLICVIAPAGFGKTMLAAHWASDVSSQASVVWLSLTADDRAPDVFLEHLLSGLAAHLPHARALLSLAAAGALPPVDCMRRIAQALADFPHELMLILDDAHMLSETAQHLLQPLLDAVGLPLHIMILSRSTPTLQMHRLAARAALVNIDAAQMRLDHDEFEAYARAHAIAPDAPQTRALLERRADGWFAGLQMLLHGQQSSRLIDEFLDSELLPPLPPALLNFLVETAPLPYLTPSLCAAATGRARAACADDLRAIVAIAPFVAELGTGAPAGEPIYRAHPLLQEMLLRRRARGAPDDERRLRHRGAQWLAQHDDVDAALELLPADDPDAVAALLTPILRPALLRYALVDARRWLAKLPPDTIAANLQIAVDAAWLEYFGETHHVRAAVTRAQNALAQFPGDACKDELRAEIGILDVLCTFIEGAHGRARADADALHDLPHDPNGLAAGYLKLFEGYVPHDSSDVDARIRSMQRAAEIFRRTGHNHGVIEATVTQAYIKRRYANADGAISGLMHALSFMHATGWEHSLFTADAAHACGEMLYLSDRIPEARSMLQRALDAARIHGAVPATAYMAKLCLQLCDIAEGNAHSFDEIEDAQVWAYLLTCNTTTPIGSVAMLRILRDQRLSRPEHCNQTIESIGITPLDLTEDMPDVIWYAVLAGSIFSRRVDVSVENKLTAFRERMITVHNNWMTLRTDVLLMLHALQHGNETLAAERLTDVLPAVERSTMSRLLTDHAALLPLLRRSPAAYAQRLAAQHTAAPPFGLSPAELQIVELLVAGYSTEAIAQKLVISVLTARGHFKKCFRKLGVHSREEAVRVAREAGIGEAGKQRVR